MFELIIVGIILFIIGLTLLIVEVIRGPTFAGITVVAFLVAILGLSIVVIDPGQVGVVNIFGTVSDSPLQAGIHVVTPFVTGIVPFSVQTQEDTQQSTVLTAEGLDVSIDMTVLYRLDPSKAPEIYKTVGSNYKAVVIDPQIRSVIRDVVATYDAKNIYSADRSNISHKIQLGLEQPLIKRGVIVESILLRSANLPQKVKDSIEAKQQMEQAIQQKQFEVQKEQMEAQRKVAEANGIADANRIISNSITAEYIEWYTVEMMKERTGDTYFIPVGSSGLPMIGNVPLTHAVKTT